MVHTATYSTFEGLRPHFDALARVGYFKIVLKSLSPLKQFLHSFYRGIVWTLVIGYNLQHIIRVIQVRHSTEQMVDTLFILLTILNTLGKQAAFNLRSRQIDQIVSVINGPYFAPSKPYHVKVLKVNAVAMSRLLALYHVAVMTCGVLWTIFPIVNRALGEEVYFTGYYPFDTTRPLAFALALTYMSILITGQAYGNVTMDCTIVAFYAQAKIQIKMLRYNLEHLLDEDDHEKINPMAIKITKKKIYKDDSANAQIQERLIKCVNHYDQIVRFTKEVESIFGEAMVIQFFVMAWVICMTVYKIVGLSILSAEFVSMAVYLGCMLAQLFIYCYYGTQLKVEVPKQYLIPTFRYGTLYVRVRHALGRFLNVVLSAIATASFETWMTFLMDGFSRSEYINQSIYCSRWLSLSPRFRRQLFVMMQCCSRPLYPRTAYVIPMSLETYIAMNESEEKKENVKAEDSRYSGRGNGVLHASSKVLKTSYTLFTFLNR